MRFVRVYDCEDGDITIYDDSKSNCIVFESENWDGGKQIKVSMPYTEAVSFSKTIMEVLAQNAIHS